MPMGGMMMHTPGMGMGMGMMPAQMMGGVGPMSAMGMNMGGFTGDGTYLQQGGGGFQNGFGGQPGFGGPQMNGAWGPY